MKCSEPDSLNIIDSFLSILDPSFIFQIVKFWILLKFPKKEKLSHNLKEFLSNLFFQLSSEFEQRFPQRLQLFEQFAQLQSQIPFELNLFCI